MKKNNYLGDFPRWVSVCWLCIPNMFYIPTILPGISPQLSGKSHTIIGLLVHLMVSSQYFVFPKRTGWGFQIFLVLFFNHTREIIG